MLRKFTVGICAIALVCLVSRFSAAEETEYLIGYSVSQCISFTGEGAHKKMCIYPGSEINIKTRTSQNVLEGKFLSMIVFDAKRIPVTSWLEVTAFPEVPKMFVKISDGAVVYAAGSGETFREAIADLAWNFRTQSAK